MNYNNVKKVLSWIVNTAGDGALSVNSILRIFNESKFKKTFRKISENEKCLILGNGPSLNSSIEKKLAYFLANDCLCVNDACLSELFFTIQPKYYLFVDPVYIKKKVCDHYEKKRSDIFNTINAKCDWPITMLFPQSAFPHITYRFRSNPQVRVESFNMTVFRGFQRLGYFFFDRGLASPTPLNVLIAAIFLSIKMGYKQIELFGADHSWHEEIFVGNDNALYLKDKHFWENDGITPVQWFKNVTERKDPWKIHELFKRWSEVFGIYHMLNDYAKGRGVEIFNCSEKSCIDAFKRKSIET